ncbi:MAG: glycosyltransferase family 4 protein [Candidatus Kerfeldbacteria bacterium]
MKVAMLGHKGIPATYGGVEVHVDHLSQRLSDMGYEVLAYARPYYVKKDVAERFNKQNKNIRVITVPTVKSKHLDTIVHTFLSTLHAMKENVDVYHFHSVGPSLLAWLPRLFRPHARVVCTFHSPDRLHQKWGTFARTVLTIGERTSLIFAHKTITVSRDLQRYCRERYFKQAVYIPNGVDEVQNVKPSLISAEYGLNEKDYIVVVSRLVRHKGIHFLIKAFKQQNTEKKLVIVGDSAYTDDYVAELKQLAGNDSRIIFTGFQSGKMLTELFSNAYLYVQPSESEGLCVAVLEAGSYGLPVLASDIPSNAEVVLDRGFMFENASVQDLSEKLGYVLNHPEEAEEAGKQLRAHVAEKYNWDRISKETTLVYESATPSVIGAEAEEVAESNA